MIYVIRLLLTVCIGVASSVTAFAQEVKLNSLPEVEGYLETWQKDFYAFVGDLSNKPVNADTAIKLLDFGWYRYFSVSRALVTLRAEWDSNVSKKKKETDFHLINDFYPTLESVSQRLRPDDWDKAFAYFPLEAGNFDTFGPASELERKLDAYYTEELSPAEQKTYDATIVRHVGELLSALGISTNTNSLYDSFGGRYMVMVTLGRKNPEGPWRKFVSAYALPPPDETNLK
jgi:hypothetical protein